MTKALTLTLLASSLHAASIAGTVVTADGGEPLARATVTLRAIGGGASSGGGGMKTDQFGHFVIDHVQPGAYLVIANRPGFVQAFYGQKRWNSAGLPLIIANLEEATNISIRMHRWGAISGRALDENDVGILGHDVLAYRDAQPFMIAAQTKTDDYGRYRIYGLEPGRYLIRSAAKNVDGVDYALTFAPSTLDMTQARRIEVPIDVEIPDIDIRPEGGKLFVVGGEVPELPGCGPMQITLAGEGGRKTIGPGSSCPPGLHGPCFEFPPVAPGDYELYGSGPCSESACPTLMTGRYMTLPVNKDERRIEFAMTCVRRIGLRYLEGFRDAQGVKAILTARIKDLAGIGETKNFGNVPEVVLLPPGRWELHLEPPATHAVSEFYVPWQWPGKPEYTRPDTWNEILSANENRGATFTFARMGISIHGAVIGEAHEPVQGAPVYLETYDTKLQRRMGEPRTVLTDTNGLYRFRGLAAGTYRVLSTFEYQSPDESLMAAKGLTVKFDRVEDKEQNLDLYVIH
jgi:protocatechuate 3,4-dioxygenase beta subunit